MTNLLQSYKKVRIQKKKTLNEGINIPNGSNPH